MAQSQPTTPRDDEMRFHRNEQRGRWAIVAALSVFLAAAVSGAFGVRSGTATASRNGYEAKATFARVTRAGLGTPWSLEVRRSDGSPFDGPITVVSDADYFAMFDQTSIDPEPVSSSSDGDHLTWTFDPPDGPVLEVSLDARLRGGVHWGRSGRSRVLDTGGAQLVAVSYKTRVMP